MATETQELPTKEIITNTHVNFMRLRFAIDIEMNRLGGCNHNYNSFNNACDALETYKGYKIDREATLEYLESKGGYCDCEILMNVDY